MSRGVVQVIRRTATTWDISRVTFLYKTATGDDTHEYEVIGRVVFERGMFFVDLAKWHKDGFEWDRQARGYALQVGAMRAITDPPSRPCA